MAIAPGDFAHFHVVESGGGFIRMIDDKEKETVPLTKGDLVIVSHGGGHIISDSLKTKPVPLPEILKHKSPDNQIIKYGGGGAKSLMICGSFQFAGMSENPIVGMLPPLI